MRWKYRFWGKGRSFWTKYSTVLNVYVQRWPHTATDQTILPGTKQSRGYFSTWQSDCRSQIKHFHLYTPKWYSQTHCQMQRTVQSSWDVPKESVSIWKVISIFISYVFSKLFRLGYILTVGIALTNEWGGFPGLINRPNSWKQYMYDDKQRQNTLYKAPSNWYYNSCQLQRLYNIPEQLLLKVSSEKCQF